MDTAQVQVWGRGDTKNLAAVGWWGTEGSLDKYWVRDPWIYLKFQYMKFMKFIHTDTCVYESDLKVEVNQSIL